MNGPQEFVWAADSSEYAVRENASTIKLFKNFKEKKTFKPDFGAEAIYGGHFLGVKSPSGLAFYDWESQSLIRRIEITPKQVIILVNKPIFRYSNDFDELQQECIRLIFILIPKLMY